MFLLFLAMMIVPASQTALAKQVVITLESEHDIQVNTDVNGERHSYEVPSDNPTATAKPSEVSQPVKPKLAISFDVRVAKLINLASIAVLAGGSIALALTQTESEFWGKNLSLGLLVVDKVSLLLNTLKNMSSWTDFFKGLLNCLPINQNTELDSGLLSTAAKLPALWYSYRLYTQYKELGETYAGAVRPESHSAFLFKMGRIIDFGMCYGALLTLPKIDTKSPLWWVWGAFIVEKISNTYVRSQEYYARRQLL